MMYRWLFTLCVALTVFWACGPERQPAELLRAADWRDSSAEARCQVAVRYPQWAAGGQDSLDALFRQAVADNVAAFREFIGPLEGEGRSLRGDYALCRADSILSVAQRFEWAVPGVSIRLIDHVNLNYDLATGQVLDLEAIFRPGLAYRDSLRSLLRPRLAARYDADYCHLSARDPLDNFTLSADSMHFYVSLYSGVPICEVEKVGVPLDTLRPWLRRL